MEEHPSVSIARLLENTPVPPKRDPRRHLTAEHQDIEAQHHSRRTRDHLLRKEAWERTLLNEQARLTALTSGG